MSQKYLLTFITFYMSIYKFVSILGFNSKEKYLQSLSGNAHWQIYVHNCIVSILDQ